MLKINQIKLMPDRCIESTACVEALKKKCAKLLRIQPEQILQISIVRRSFDGRKKPELFYSFSLVVQLEKELERKILDKKKRDRSLQNVSQYEEKRYRFPTEGREILSYRPVIIGTGPAGLFCGYYLAKYGYRPILLERGKCVEERKKDVEAFWQSGHLNPESNVQFGEGGAGTFSDGKLNTLVKDAYGRQKEVLKIFVEHGAKEEILYESKPHIGTDILSQIVQSMRASIIQLGGEVRFQSKVTDFVLNNGIVEGVVVNGEEIIPTQTVVLAIGHSARDTFMNLHKQGLLMTSKPFAVGVRIEHPQEWINDSQYGTDCRYQMPSADYKVTTKASDGRGVYSFCMCPGGYVVNASSEPGRLAVNGMSYSKRDGQNANSAMIVTVNPEDYKTFLEREGRELTLPECLYGIMFQQMLEEKAYAAANGKIPVQRFGDYKQNKPSVSFGKVVPQMKGAYGLANVREILPEEIGNGLMEGIENCGRKIPGFSHDDVLVSAVESRTSSPVRIERDDNCIASVKGVFPCGEGAGYAGGITSAAMDGIRVAEAIARKYKSLKGRVEL